MAAERHLLLSTVLLLLLAAASLGRVEADAEDTILTLEEVLPKNYDKTIPPKNNGKPTLVSFHMSLMSLNSLDESSMTYSADIFLNQDWMDHRLRLRNLSSGYRILDVDWLKHIWRPDTFFKNAESVGFQTMTVPNHYLWQYKNQSLLYTCKVTLELTCAMSFRVYPHDTQECKIQMETLSLKTDDLIYRWQDDAPLWLEENIELPQLELVDAKIGDCTHTYHYGDFSCLEVVFTMRRRLGYHLFNTYIPTSLIVIISWISFWIKPEVAPARVTLGVTSLLTLSTQHAKTQAQLPPVSYLKFIDGFMSVCTLFVFMALMEYCVVNIVLGDGVGEKAAEARRRAVKIDRISRILFPTMFLIINVLYWLGGLVFVKYI